MGSCCAGTTTRYSFGDTISEKEANFNKLEGKTIDVGKYPANAWGFHDMHGNVSEWVVDLYGSYNDPKKKDPGRVFRGGSWTSVDGALLRSASRSRNPPGNKGNHLGFRLSLQKESVD